MNAESAWSGMAIWNTYVCLSNRYLLFLIYGTSELIANSILLSGSFLVPVRQVDQKKKKKTIFAEFFLGKVHLDL